MKSLGRKFRRIRESLARVGRNGVAAWRIRNEIRPERLPLHDLNRYQRSVFSQNGEDGMLEAIFAAIGTTNRYFVEFGVEDAKQCNSRLLLERRGWSGLLMDGKEGVAPSGAPVRGEFINAENVEALFAKYGVSKRFDLLSIDIDGNDYWVWKAIRNYRPRVVVIEYNASRGPEESCTIAYDPRFVWGGTDYFGASLRALQKLGEEKGYTLLACDDSGTNAFFLEAGAFSGHFLPRPIEQIYRKPAYRNGQGHPPDPSRRMTPV